MIHKVIGLTVSSSNNTMVGSRLTSTEILVLLKDHLELNPPSRDSTTTVPISRCNQVNGGSTLK